MKRFVIPTAVFFLSMLVFAGSTLAAGEKDYGKDKAQKDQKEMKQKLGLSGQAGQQGQLQAANELEGKKIKSAQGEELGEIEKLMVDTQEGRIGYVVVSPSDGIAAAEEKYIVPFNALSMDQQEDAFTLQMDAEKMKEAPKGDIQQAMDRERGREIHQFYGASPYWEEGIQSQERQQELMKDQQKAVPEVKPKTKE